MTQYLSDFPALMVEWDWDKNSLEGVDPSKVSHSSAKYNPWWICAIGHSYQSKAHRRTRGRGCPICAGRQVVKGINDLATTHPDLAKELVDPACAYTFSKGSDKKVSWECQEGHIWETKISHRVRGSGCPYCSGQISVKGVNDLQTVNKTLADQLVDSSLAQNLTRNSGRKVLFRCSNGHERLSYVYSRKDDGSDCPRCVSNISSAEVELQEWLSSKINIETNNREIIPPKELDIYIPDLKIAIEFNGLYYHSEKFKPKDFHKEKTLLCLEKGIQLIHVWGDDDLESIHKMLLHKLGLSTQDRIPARKTEVHSITNQEAFEFLNANHIQGKARGTYYLGLKTKDTQELVAVMVLKRIEDTLTLERYATSYIVPGGQSKLLKYVDNNIPYTKMTTFADLSISDGTLYEKTGWVKDKILAPDYKYIVNGMRVHKFNYRISRFKSDPNLLFEEGMTERQLAEMNGLLRIYDCGKIRYVRYP